jgi:nicotinamidase-related amidase
MTTVDPSATALLILDYQPATLGFLPDSDAFVAPTRAAADALRQAGVLVGFVRVAFTYADYAGFPSHSVMGNRVQGNRPGLDEGAATAALHHGLEVAAGDLALRKTRVGAFSTTQLDSLLTDAGVRTLLVCGVHTSGAVLTTVREAHDLDYEVIVLRDACADPDPDVHSFLLERVFPRQGSVATTTEVLDAVGVSVSPL